MNLRRYHVTPAVLLDLSASFDRVDLGILPRHLNTVYQKRLYSGLRLSVRA